MHPLTQERLLDVLLAARDDAAARAVLERMHAADGGAPPWAASLLQALRQGNTCVGVGGPLCTGGYQM